jgi:hypothetical protein
VIKLRHQQPSMWHKGLVKDIEDLWEPWRQLRLRSWKPSANSKIALGQYRPHQLAGWQGVKGVEQTGQNSYLRQYRARIPEEVVRNREWQRTWVQKPRLAGTESGPSGPFPVHDFGGFGVIIFGAKSALEDLGLLKKLS